MDSTDHYSVKLIFQAHLRMYSLTHTDSFVQPIPDTNRQSCTIAQAALFQGILLCKIGSRYFLHLNYIHKISLDKVQYNQQNNTRTESKVVKRHNVRSRNYCKVGFNFSLEMIRLKLGKLRFNTPLENWAQTISAGLSENW
jgi:hypothetical protein